MGNESTTMQQNINFTATGIEDVIKKVETLETNLKEVATQADTIATHFEKLGKTHINVNSINPNQSQYKVGRNNFVLRDSKEDKETKTILNKQLEKANEAELQATIAHTNALNADTEKIKKQTEQADAVLEVRQRNSETNKKNSENRSRYLDKNMNWYKYRDEHPEMFVSRSSQSKYQWGATLSEVGHTVSGLGGAGARIGGDLTSVFGMALKNGPLALATQGISKLISGLADLSKASIQAYSEIETLKTGLSIISPTQVQADTLFRDVADYATRSPYGVAQSTELVTLLKQSGVNDSELMSTLTMLGDTAGGNMEKLKRIANNYAQIVSIGKASMLDMRQFAYAGIPIFEAVSKELGVTQQALREMISDGKVTSDVIEKVFKDLTSSNGIFANATAIGAKTFAARKQNLADTKQLALAEMGEVFINIGSGWGSNLQNEGVGREFLNFSENIYQGLQRWANGANIEKSITNIEKRESRISELKELIEYNKSLGNENIVKDLERELKDVLNLRDIEKDRASYNAAYDRNRQDILDVKKEYPELPSDIETLNPSYAKKMWLTTSSKLIDGIELSEDEVASIDRLSMAWEAAYNALVALNNITPQMEQANIETLALQQQQTAADYTEKTTTSPESIYNVASQIKQAYMETDAYKAEEEKKREENWKRVISILSDIKKVQKEDGTVDFAKLGVDKFVKYLDDEGAFSVERKLSIVEGKNAVQLETDRGLLTSQYTSTISAIKDYMKENNINNHLISYFLDDFSKKGLANLDTQTFYKWFAEVYTDTGNAISRAISQETDPKVLEHLNKIQKTFDKSTLLLSTNTEAVGYDIDEVLKGKGGSATIPLWKRIIGGATGLSPNTIDTTKGALGKYRDDLAIRNTTSGVLRAGLQSGLGVDFVQSILNPTGEAKKLEGDPGKTFQIDWKKTGEAVRKFAFEMSKATSVMTAYKSGLEAQLNTYETLLSEGLTATETQEIQKHGSMSMKKYEKLMDDYGDQLVNAFGEKLITEDGLEVSFKDGQFFDESGKQVDIENVRLTGNIFDFLKAELPKIREKISEASIEENKRKLTSQLTNNVIDIPLFSKLLQQERNGQRVFSVEEYAALSKSKSFVMTDFDNQLNRVREEYAKEGKEIGSNEEVYKDIVGGTADTTTIAAFNEAVELTTQSLRDFLDTMGTQGLLAANYRAEYDRSLLEAANLLSGKRDTNLYGFTPEEVSTDATKQAGIGGFAQREFYGPMLENAGLSPSLYVDDVIKASINPEALQAYNNYTQELTTGLLSNIKTPITPQGFNLPQQSFGEQFNSDMTSGLGLDGLSQQKLPDLPDYEKVAGKLEKANLAAASFKKTLGDASKAMGELASSTLKDGFIAPFEKLGETMTDSSASMSDLKDVYKKLGADLLSNIGPLITNVGLSMAQAGALEGNWGKVAAGLALAAAGGIVGGLGKGLSNSNESENSKDDEFERLESLKNDLSKLLEQARRDAAYYENNMKHKNALGVNEQFSYRSVNDAIITPQGHVISTHPDDYLIATKQPQNLVGQNTVQPIINNNVINNSSAKVTQETKENDDGTIDIITIIEEVTSNYISSDRSDEAFAARDYRLKGRQAVM